MNKDIMKLLRDRYFLSNEVRWEDLVKRVSGLYPDIYDEFLNKDFIFSSPTLFNANTNGERAGTLSSCFILDVEDSIKGIFSALGEAALVTQAGGGVGFNFSSLRSSVEQVNSIKRSSSGPLPFINIFNAMLDGIQQGGIRRGAGMAMLMCDHPDILNFIEAKKDVTKYTRFNFSVMLTDDFYRELEKNPNSAHMVKYKDGTKKELKNDKGNIVTTKQLWDAIIDRAWAFGEPGVFNQSIAYRQCTTTNLSDNILSNPCFSGNERLLTSEGYKTFEELDGTEINIINDKGEAVLGKIFKTGSKPVITLKFSNKESLTCTEDHIFKDIESKEIQAKDTKGKKIKRHYYKTNNHDPLYVKLGFIQGDGNTSRLASKHGHIGLEINFGEKDKDVLTFFNYTESQLNKSARSLYTSEFTEGLHEIGMSSEILPNRVLPSEFQCLSSEERKSFLCGLFSANGCVIKNYRIAFKTTCFELVTQLKHYLEIYGINSYITTNKATKVKFLNGTYLCRESYDLNIGKIKDIIEFYEQIGFIQQYKQEALLELIEVRTPYVVNIYKEEDPIDVYDFTLYDDYHWGVVNGIVAHNCQEYIGIPGTACSLGSINLVGMLNNGNFDWGKFETLVVKGVNALNAVMDNNKFPIDKITEITLKTRPIGLGTMGIADLLYSLGVPYNSKEGLKLGKDIHRYMTIRGMKESIELAKNHGAYEAFDYDLFILANKRFFTKAMCRDIVIEDLLRDLKNYGIRNSSITSIAPTGSIAFIANVSSGMEPVFALVYSRRIEVGDNKHEVVYVTNPVFDKYLSENFKEEEKIKILEEISKNNGSCQGIKEIPVEKQKIFITAGDMEPIEHLDMLEVIATNTSLSVSKTVNAPSDIPKEKVAEVYLEAHKRGIIGVTVYRDGSREGILQHSDPKNNIIERDAPKRPKSLPCDVYKIKYNAKDWVVFVGLLNNKPYEVFAGQVDEVNISKHVTSGTIEKIGSNHYSFIYEGEVLIKNIIKTFDNTSHDDFARVLSLSLRTGANIRHAIDQLKKSKGDITTFSKVIARALQKYLEGQHAGLCPECSSKLVYKNNCVECAGNCGWQSPCG